MKVTLIKASQDNYFKSYKKYQGSPPQNIFSAAAALQGKAKIEMYDETSGMKVPNKIDSDLVVIYMSTPDAYRGYELADSFMRQGIKVILGGLHPSFMMTEALLHAHAVIKGESDLLWDEILADVSANKLKAAYEATQLQDLSSLTPYPTNIIT
ncbi:radical SAM protein, partial [Photobacterium sp. OFAV2-7]|nr:radical SAM protein [Photobacterium sp. OFAV2-7]